VTGPNFIHRHVAIAAAEAGKHVWVEKPAGRNAAETQAISDAVRANNVQSAVDSTIATYRQSRWPSR
jgi:predicted dehydrogenase